MPSKFALFSEGPEWEKCASLRFPILGFVDEEQSQSGVLGPWVYTRDESGWRWANVGDPNLRVEEQTWTGGGALVLGHDRDACALVVIELEQALTLAKAWDAVRLDDLDEAMARLPEPYRSQAADLAADAALDGREIDTDWLYMWAMEGGFEWPAQQILTLLPEPIIEQFGEPSFSGVSGPCLLIDLKHRADLVQALRDMGYEVIEDDILTAAASGADPA